MKHYFFSVNIDSETSIEEIKAFLQSRFQSFTVVCYDTLRVAISFLEASRGFCIAKGEKIGRVPMRAYEIERKNGAYIEEAIFLHCGIPINARIGKSLRLNAFSDSDEWADGLVNVLSQFSKIKEFDRAVWEPEGEIFGNSADIERRLEEGDFEDGGLEQGNPIGHFVKHFPQYQHLFQSCEFSKILNIPKNDNL